MSFLLFDYDRSYASIGGDVGVESHLGLPPLKMQGGIDTFKQTLNRVYTAARQEIDHPVVGPTGEFETKIIPNNKGQEYDLQGVIVDSATRLADYELDKTIDMMNTERQAEGEPPLQNLTRTWWGRYGDRLVRLFRMLSKLDSIVVCTAHEGIDTDDVGRRYHSINMKGSASGKMPEYFDVVAFLRTDAQADRRYLYTRQSTAYPQSKDRKYLLGGEIDYIRDGNLRETVLADIVQTYREAGTEHPKILLIGGSGAGKTLLLKTLNPLVTTPTTE